MKTSNIIAVALAATLYTVGLTSCADDYNDTGIKDRITALDKRVTDLETKVKTDIAGIQAAINTINGYDYVKSIKEVEDGYEITFSKGTVATIKKGIDGADGVDGKDGATPKLTAEKDTDGNFYWKVNGEWLMNGADKVPTSKTPKMTVDEFEGQKYWKIDGEWLTDADGNKVAFGADSTPTGFSAKVNPDGTVSFMFGADEYKMAVAANGLTITDPNEGIIFNSAAVIYYVALPKGWAQEDLAAIRADIASKDASGLDMVATRAASWAVTVAKDAAKGGANVTVTPTDLSANQVAELTVTFVKKSGERLTGSIFITVRESVSAKQTITVNTAGDVATAIAGYKTAGTINTNIEIDGSTAMNASDWAALKSYKCISTLAISNTASSVAIPAAAFKDCTALTTVTLASSTFTAIPASAFEGCTGLTTFTGTTNITNIEANAFKGCATLAVPTAVTNVVAVGASAFEGCKTAVFANNTFSTLTSIGQYAFSGCAAMTALPTLDNAVTALPQGVFKECVGLTTTAVTLAEITSIGEEAFRGCTTITAVTCAKATTIGKYALRGCNKMTTAAFEAATTIGDEAFVGCRAMTALTLGTVTSIGNNAFGSVKTNDCDLTLGKGTTAGTPDKEAGTWADAQWNSVAITE